MVKNSKVKKKIPEKSGISLIFVITVLVIAAVIGVIFGLAMIGITIATIIK
jgi:ABC-type dipeptide/oligopeptide/nickel transport system permease component